MSAACGRTKERTNPFLPDHPPRSLSAPFLPLSDIFCRYGIGMDRLAKFLSLESSATHKKRSVFRPSVFSDMSYL